MAEARSRQIIIAGAGIAGLTAALAFAVRGYPVRVFERAQRLDEIGAGIQLSPNATRILDRLGVLARPAPYRRAARRGRAARRLEPCANSAACRSAQLPNGAGRRPTSPPTAPTCKVRCWRMSRANPASSLSTGATVRDVDAASARRDGFGRDRRPHRARRRACCWSAPTASGRTCGGLSAARRRAAFRARSPGAGPSGPKALPAVRSPGSASAVSSRRSCIRASI